MIENLKQKFQDKPSELVLLIFILGFFIYAIIYRIVLFSSQQAKIIDNKFNEQDYSAMVLQIENMYGNGKNFNIIDKDSYEITEIEERRCGSRHKRTCKKKVYIGEQAEIIGYFDNERIKYLVKFERYLTGSPHEQGNNVIILTYIDNNYN